MKLILVTAEDGDLLAINVEQIEHVRYRHGTGPGGSSVVEIMFVGNPERTLFSGRVAEEFWRLLTDIRES